MESKRKMTTSTCRIAVVGFLVLVVGSVSSFGWQVRVDRSHAASLSRTTHLWSTTTDAEILSKEVTTTTTPFLSIVEQCYEAWNNRNMNAAADCFSDSFVYDDGQFLGTLRNDKSRLKSRFESSAKILPPNSKIIIDHLAVCPNTNNIGAQWHVEINDGGSVPLTNGCSFYTVDSKTGLIETAFKVSEMLVKPSKDVADGLVNSASRLSFLEQPTNEPLESTSLESDSSIIEQYFRAWNDRDMERALNCFVEDCTYQTEDPVFVDKFVGKEALREHLVKNASALPSSCRIVLDDLAIDPSKGTFGVKWHLEASGFAIPNLRGCSMYTLDKDTGLLKTGYDVTEAPVKVPDTAQTVLSFLPFSVFSSIR